MKSVISSGFTAVAGGTAFCALQSSGANATTESQIQNVMPIAGTLDQLYINLSTAPGVTKQRAFTVRKNSSSTLLTATVSGTNTTASDTTDTVTLAAGDIIGMQEVATSSTTGAFMAFALRFTATTPGESFVLAATQTQITGVSTQYIPIQGDATFNATETNVEVVMPTSGTFSNLYVSLDTVVAGASFIVTLVKNGSTTSLAATVPIAGSTANDLTHSVSVVAGDTLSFQLVNNSATTPRVRIGMRFVPTISGESIWLLNAAQTIAQGSTEFQLAGSNQIWAFAEGNRNSVITACTARSLYSVCPGLPSGQKFTTTLRKNVADTALTNQITGTSSTNKDTTHTVNYNNGDTVCFKGATTASTGTVRPKIGVVFFVSNGSTTARSLSGIGK